MRGKPSFLHIAMKKLFVLLVGAIIASSVFAGSISRGGGSFSSSRSFSSSPARSLGMSRPSISPSRPSYSTPMPSTSPRYSAPAPSVAPSYRAPSSGGGFLSSFGGSFAGSMLGNAIFGHGSGGGGTTVVNGGGAGGGAPTVISQGYSGPSFFDILGFLLVAVIIGLSLWLLWRTFRSSGASPQDEDDATLPFSPVVRFMEIQKAFAAKDVQTLRTLLGPDLVEQILADLPDEPGECTLKSVVYSVLDVSGRVISIRFMAKDTADDSTLKETWHFLRAPYGTSWLLNGIEQ
jgi:predicted lipid-binding transport protein (Tim44 family)